MHNTDLIAPMEYHGPGTCPMCFTTLVLVDREINVMDLDKHGNVVNIEETLVTCQAMCPKCGHSMKMMRSGGIYRPYSEVMKTIEDLETSEIIDRRMNSGRYSIEGNPLASEGGK